MCRHLAYLGPPASLRSVLIDPPHGLYTVSYTHLTLPTTPYV